jgi:hypothetical protein
MPPIMTSFLRLLLVLLPLAAQASLVVGPAMPLAEPAERTGAHRPQQDVSVAWNGERGFVAWRARIGQRDVVLGNHIDSTGKPLEAAPLRVFSEGSSFSTRVVSLGSRFLVIWNYYENTTSLTRGALVSADGSVRHLGRIGPETFSATGLATNGTTAVLVGTTGTPDYLSVLVWIDEEGQTFSSRTYGRSMVISTRVTSDGTSFFVVMQRIDCGVYTCSHTFYLIRANADGTSDEPRQVRFIDETQSFSYVVNGIAASRDRILLTFQEPQRVAAMLFDHEGNVVTEPFGVEDIGASGVPMSVESDGSAFVLAYPHTIITSGEVAPEFSTRLRRISASGATEPAVLANETRFTALEWTGSGYLLATTSDHPGISVTRLPPSGAPIAGTPEYVLSRFPNHQETVDALWDGSQSFSAWEEFFPVEGLWRVKYGRNDANGNALDGRGRAIASSENSQRTPRVVFDGSRYLVLWTEIANHVMSIYARRVHRDGTPAGEAFVVAPTYCGFDIDAAAVGDRVYVTHLAAGCESNNRLKSVLVTTVEANDMVSSSTIVAQEATFASPIIESAGASALVLWVESVTRVSSDPCPYPYEYCPPKQLLRGVIVGDGTTKRVSLADDDRMVNREPQIAWNGSHYLVAWVGGRDVNTVQALFAQPVSATGDPRARAQLVANDIAYNYGPERRGSVVATSSGFLLAWQRLTWQPSLSLFRVTSHGAPFGEQQIDSDVADLRGPVLTPRHLIYSLSGPDDVYLGHNRIVWRSLQEIARTRAVRH